MADAKGKDAPPKGKEAKVAKKRVGDAVKGGDEKKRKVGKPRNYNLGNGVYRFSRSRMYKKKAIYKFIGKKTPKTVKPKKPSFIEKPIGGDKNGGTRKVLVKKRKNYYPTADRIRKRPSKKLFSQHRHKLRKSLTPGRVCIVLAGPHKGKRVVFLKQLRSGLLLVTGPFKVNACPLRRINQIYVIATSTSLDLSGVKIPDHVNDDYFKRNRQKRAKKEEGDIFSTKKENYGSTHMSGHYRITVEIFEPPSIVLGGSSLKTNSVSNQPKSPNEKEISKPVIPEEIFLTKLRSKTAVLKLPPKGRNSKASGTESENLVRSGGGNAIKMKPKTVIAKPKTPPPPPSKQIRDMHTTDVKDVDRESIGTWEEPNLGGSREEEIALLTRLSENDACKSRKSSDCVEVESTNPPKSQETAAASGNFKPSGSAELLATFNVDLANPSTAYKPSDQRKQDQVSVDKQILDVIRKHPEKKMMYAYLGSMFGLRSGKYPHKLKF